ncbi:MAG: Type 1 glutamine amidotransferase-like domain-containing protein [Clostridia bacterium]|nr:Type 1 glutamine amidotransferase-like domain-containing protein [Clostridia bacterium]
MINIFLDICNIDEEPFFSETGRYFKADDKVCIVAFSFKDDAASCAEDWERLYSKNGGYYYDRVVRPLLAHGIDEENIYFVNYFTDSKEKARKKIADANLLVFPGGNTRRLMERIIEFDLFPAIKDHGGVVMGYSAGAVIQLAEYHSPVYYREYPDFKYCKCLGLLDGFYLEVHYEGRDEQKESIKRVLAEKRKRIYAFEKGRAALIFDNGKIRTIGEVLTFEPGE